ncbi:hypothetical protein KW783_00885 [Candidatus Parcubacteria bacterium]|nr:hypothetical protein [Candidatus Parcubacteria bacterium]
MSQEKMYSALEKEIKRINEKIDIKIIKGKPYRREAKTHRRLLAELGKVSRLTYA